MSKNITILEGSTSKQFASVAKLRTNLQGGGTCNWVPEDDVRLKSLYASENGEYDANDEGYYGYNPVVVSGVGGVAFTAEDGDVIGGNPLIGGNGYWHDEDGVHPIPSYIAMTTPPIRTKYYEGDTINLAGSVVQAFNADGSIWTNDKYPQGGIPYKELILDPSVAPKPSGAEDYIILDDGVIAYPFVMSLYNGGIYQWRDYKLGVSSRGARRPYYLSSDKPCAGFAVSLGQRIYYYLTAGMPTDVTFATDDSSSLPSKQSVLPLNVWGGFMVYYVYASDNMMQVSPVAPTQETVPTGIYDTNVRVTWHRWGDGAELNTNFTIEVRNDEDSE